MVLGNVESRNTNNDRGTYQEHGRRDLNLAFWTEDGNYIGRGFFVRESNPAVRLILDVVNEYIFVSEKRAMISAGNDHRLIQVILILFPKMSAKIIIKSSLEMYLWVHKFHYRLL